jgi:hypothetical protein
VDAEGEPFVTLSIPAGRNKRVLGIYTEPAADALLALSFEKYRFLAGYEAICCYEERSIEAGLRTTNGMASQFILQRLANQPWTLGSMKVGPIELSPPESSHGRPAIEIGPCSAEFMVFGRAASSVLGRAAPITIKLRGARATQHDQALSELRSYADSLFFQIDMLHGSTFILERERRRRLSPPTRRPAAVQLAYPMTHYNEEAISLYWYAKSAIGMPLLRFLAFYQSIEFYFPRYSQTEARKRVGAIIKHPTFRPYRDDDLDRLISAIQLERSGGRGSERSQLRTVVSECISAEQIREYLLSSKEREEHFSGRTPKAKYHKISLQNKNADLRNDVADRLYDIRCKIVHTKNEHAEDELRMILPFSEDAEYLLHDIDLVEFVARNVLVSSSGELT